MIEAAWTSAYALSKGKFKQESTLDMELGPSSHFRSDLHSLIGPPMLMDGSIIEQMKHEHCSSSDSTLEFTCSRGVSTTSRDEWEVAWSPTPGKEYPEVEGFREHHPEWCRQIRPITDFEGEMDRINSKLSSGGHAVLLLGEMLAGRLYTGPMHHKYNLVLRSKSASPCMSSLCQQVCTDNDYTTTIHAINSLVLTLMSLTSGGKVYRGMCHANLPDCLWEPDAEGMRCGVEYGFFSTSRERLVALRYATGPVGTLFHMPMGLRDRGAEMAWISQYPHELEVLFPPLLGVEMTDARVDSDLLVVSIRPTINAMTRTLSQVISTQKDLFQGQVECMGEELKWSGLSAEDANEATAIFQAALELRTSPMSYSPQWFKDYENYLKGLWTCHGMKVSLARDVNKLPKSLDREEPLLHADFRGFEGFGQLPTRNQHRALLIAAWLKCNSQVTTLDLRNIGLVDQEVLILLHEVFEGTQSIIAIDLRENPEMGTDVAVMLEERVLADWCSSSINSLCGITATNSTLDIPRRNIPPTDLVFLAWELESFSWDDSNTDTSEAHAQIRRSPSSTGWSPLHFAAREGVPQLCAALVKRGHDIDTKGGLEGGSGCTPLIVAVQHCKLEVVQQLLEMSANVDEVDGSGQTALEHAQLQGVMGILILSEIVRAVEADQKRVEAAVEEAAKSEAEAIQKQMEAGGAVIRRLRGGLGSVTLECCGKESILLLFNSFSTVGAPESTSKSGVLYYEATVECDCEGPAQLGFAAPTFEVGGEGNQGVGDDTASWAADGTRKLLWHQTAGVSAQAWDCEWTVGDVIGLAANVDAGMIAFAKNGDWSVGKRGAVFRDDAIKAGVYPALSASNYSLNCAFAEASWKHCPPPMDVWASKGS